MGSKKPSPSSTQSTNDLKKTKKKAVIASSDEDDPPSVKDKKTVNPTTTSNKRRIVYSDDDDNNTPSKKKPNISKVAESKEKPKLKIVEDVNDVFGSEPIKRIEKSVDKKPTTEGDINDFFMDDSDDLDLSTVPEVDISVNKTNGEQKEVKGTLEPMDDSVIEGTPKQSSKNDKKKYAKKAALDSSNVLDGPVFQMFNFCVW